MAKNIEEFLKMAASRRQQQQAGGQPQAPQQPPQPQQQPRVFVQPEIIEYVDEIEVVDPLRDQSVGTHVTTHIDTSGISQHADNLGNRVSLAGSKTEQRIHQKFDQQVGHLDADSIQDIGEVSAARTDAYDAHSTPEIALELAQLFRTPNKIRQAILLKEVLERPDWDS